MILFPAGRESPKILQQLLPGSKEERQKREDRGRGGRKRKRVETGSVRAGSTMIHPLHTTPTLIVKMPADGSCLIKYTVKNP